LLPDVCLLRRRDAVSVIGAALLARAAGQGHRSIAGRLGVPKDTVRGWLRRFARDAEAIRALFSRWAFALDVELGAVLPAGSGFADAVAVVGVAARAFVSRFGPREVWPVVAALSGGVLLCHTSCPFPGVP
jgi:Homeodomain-like domain-containing protein